MNKLNIFVSSTCYDLSQVRTDLHNSLSNLGHSPILSEFPTFPIDPSKNTVENCIEAINNSADVFVLIIGTRYGYKLESGKSITNMEFLAAQNKGIPTYVFIHKQIINLIPVYLKNKESDYSTVVDNKEIFEFANEVRNNSGLWNFEFDNFQDIDNILKTQISYLFKDSLKLRNKFHQNPLLDFHSKLSSQALKIILLKESLYEYEFLAQVLVDEIQKLELLRKDYEYKVILNHKGKIKDNSEFIDWARERLAGITSYVPSLIHLLNVLVPKYLNEPGKPSDLKGLYYIGNTYSRIYKSLIDWSIETMSIAVEDNQKELQDCLAELTSKVVKDVWDLPFQYLEEIKSVKKRVQNGEENIELKIKLTLSIDSDVLKKYTIAFEKFRTSLK